MTSDILKCAEEAALLPCPFCGRAAHLRDDASHSTAAFIGCETEGCFGYMLWAETATDAAREWNQRPDMAAAIAERDEQIERLTARAEAAEAMAAIRMKALKVAMMYLTPLQPGDSRAVDDWFVACAAVQCELDDTGGQIEACLDAAMKEGR